jgi:hypothetical protein
MQAISLLHPGFTRRWQTCMMNLSLPRMLPRLISSSARRVYAASAMALASIASGTAWSQPAANVGAGELQARYAQIKEQLNRSLFKRPLLLESTESGNMLSGSVDALLPAPYATVSATFRNPARWCDVMMLHLNTKSCRASGESAPGMLKVHIGRKTAQQLNDASELNFDLRVLSAGQDVLQVAATAPRGPLGTTDYRLEIQAVPIGANSTFLRLRYSYGYGATGRLAMKGYLATAGAGKVGFTPEKDAGGDGFVGGMRGAVERNTMRYYLAIESYLAALARPASDQLDARLQHWFDATEQYPRQLREVNKADYMTMKKAELLRLTQAGTVN